MPSDLTAAASRYTADDNQCQMAFLQDAFALAGFAASLLDEEPLTPEWLASIGFTEDHYGDTVLWTGNGIHEWGLGFSRGGGMRMPGKWFYSAGSTRHQTVVTLATPPTTRGAVRRLLFALQIETKENRDDHV